MSPVRFSWVGRERGWCVWPPVHNFTHHDSHIHPLLHRAVYPRSLEEQGEGRFLTTEDAGKPNIVISRKIAKDYPGPDGQPRKVGETLEIGGKPFTVVGLYETGSMLLDVVVVMDLDAARGVLKFSPEMVSSFYVESVDPARNDQTSLAIETALAGVDARSMGEFMANFTVLMSQIDKFLLMTVSLALLVGVVGIINTMLMSTSERFL